MDIIKVEIKCICVFCVLKNAEFNACNNDRNFSFCVCYAYWSNDSCFICCERVFIDQSSMCIFVLPSLYSNPVSELSVSSVPSVIVS